jgi:hypothetical protein
MLRTRRSQVVAVTATAGQQAPPGAPAVITPRPPCRSSRRPTGTVHRRHRPEWNLGLLCGAGALIGGYLGARLHRRLPERALRLLLGSLATLLAVLYLAQSIR